MEDKEQAAAIRKIQALVERVKSGTPSEKDWARVVAAADAVKEVEEGAAVWSEVAQGFVEGFVHGYYQATKATGMDGAAVRREAEQKAIEHVNILKQGEGQKRAATSKDAPLDAMFQGKASPTD